MGIMVDSLLLRVMQDLYHQPYLRPLGKLGLFGALKEIYMSLPQRTFLN